ncbi:MAG: formylmethanofuran dehydrogenase subunit E family protein [Candidatus Freyarchaeota archaeon]|nr:formylmethanofuran dehydrogenase subunit E family protein [Candidatus Jordarchaeia archaeon]
MEDLLKFAVRLHGHLGPFLVLGLRAGLAARRLIGKPASVEVNVSPKPPVSCVIDGIQASSGCTVGNGRLTLNPTSDRLEIRAVFRSDKKAIEILFSRELIEGLLSRMPTSGEELERKAMSLLGEDEQRLFTLKTRS